MNLLYAPWRAAYVKEEKKSEECPFCVVVQTGHDATHFVLERTEHVVVLLNKYPYNTGHLLVIPHSHTGQITEVPAVVRSALMEAAAAWTTVLQDELKCHGFNVGFNIGAMSGGSIPDHLHMHVLPRWQGDTSFLATLADTKLVSINLHDLYKALVKRKNRSN